MLVEIIQKNLNNITCSNLLDKISSLKVSIIIPARNEEKTLSFLLSSIQSQTVKPHEVILVNDQSEDGTEAIGRQFGVKIINTESLPEGWLGKNWACYRGAKNASGNLFLFLDADTAFEPGGLERLLACYLKYKGVVSVEPYHKIKKFYENFAVYFNIILMGSMNVFTPLQFKLKPIGAFGPCLLCDRETYFSIDGHSSTKDKIMEDLELGKILYIQRHICILLWRKRYDFVQDVSVWNRQYRKRVLKGICNWRQVNFSGYVYYGNIVDSRVIFSADADYSKYNKL